MWASVLSAAFCLISSSLPLNKVLTDTGGYNVLLSRNLSGWLLWILSIRGWDPQRLSVPRTGWNIWNSNAKIMLRRGACLCSHRSSKPLFRSHAVAFVFVSKRKEKIIKKDLLWTHEDSELSTWHLEFLPDVSVKIRYWFAVCCSLQSLFDTDFHRLILKFTSWISIQKARCQNSCLKL